MSVVTNRPVILLNAPPNAGKDTIAHEISCVMGWPHKEFKGKLFELAKAISGLDDAAWEYIYHRDRKEKPQEVLWGLSPRDFMIDISERMIKPLTGKNYFGEILGRECAHGAVVSDSGFNEEAEALCRTVGANNVYCVRFTREGCSFNGDSRNYLTTPMIKHYLDTSNDGTIQELVEEILDWYTKLEANQ